MFSVLSSIPIRETGAGGYQMCRRQDPLKTAFGLKDHYSTELQFATHVEAQNREGTIFKFLEEYYLSRRCSQLRLLWSIEAIRNNDDMQTGLRSFPTAT